MSSPTPPVSGSRPASSSASLSWSLEVTKGTVPGHRHPLPSRPGDKALVLGNRLNGEPGIDLRDQEPPNSPRRMSGRHARIDPPAQPGESPRLTDLEGSTGTFVNRQRLLAGQVRPLKAGDLIQLGPVQLQVVAEALTEPQTPTRPSPPPSAAALSRPVAAKAQNTPAPALAKPVARTPQPQPNSLPNPPGTPTRPPQPQSQSSSPPPIGKASATLAGFQLKDGPLCRSWQDFARVSAQRWGSLREELVSGRLAGFFHAQGRPDLAPDPNAPGSPDERLDAWLARLPITPPPAPELDLNPTTLNVRMPPPGASTTRTIRVSNVGYRILKGGPPRVEPANTPWLKLSPPFDRRAIVVIDQPVHIPVDIALAETADPAALAGKRAAILFETNGGVGRVEVVLERAPQLQTEPNFAGPPDDPAASVILGASWIAELRAELADTPPLRRLILGGLALGGLRLLAGLLNAGFALAGLPIGSDEPAALGVALPLTLLGVFAGLKLASERSDAHWSDRPPLAIAGAIVGLCLTALVTATFRSVEDALGLRSLEPPWLASALAVPLWFVVGGVLLAFLGSTPPTTSRSTPPSPSPSGA